MEAVPKIGDRYYQEFNANDVLDQAAVLARGEQETVPAGNFSNVLRTRDTSVMEPTGLKDKLFAPGLGSIKEIGYNYLTGEVTEVVQLISAKLNGQEVKQVVSPNGFTGRNAAGRLVGQVRLDGEVELNAVGAVAVIEAIFGNEADFQSQSDISLANSVLAGPTTLDATGTVGLRGLKARQRLDITSEADVHIQDSKFRAAVAIVFGDGDSLLAVKGSAFSSLAADGGLGQNTFSALGGNTFGKLRLKHFK